MRKLLFVFCTTIGVWAGSGCATLKLKPEYRTMGEYAPDADRAVRKRFSALNESTNPLPQKVKVFVDALPKGIKLEGNVIFVAKGYQHKILGKFSMGPDAGAFPGHKAKWRKYHCYWQVPLPPDSYPLGHFTPLAVIGAHLPPFFSQVNFAGGSARRFR